MIRKMSGEYNAELTDFLYKHNKLKEYFIAWIPESYQEISLLDKNSFILCFEDDEIIGCLGTYISSEQKVARLLGPIIIQDYFEKYIDDLFQQCEKGIPKDITEIKIAFYQENIQCRNWCERNGFELYNAEKTMVYKGNRFMEYDLSKSVVIKHYEPKYREGLRLVHPEGTFFTLNELINSISDRCHVLLAVVEDDVVGYVCYEQTEDNEQGEIILLHVRNDKRNQGYGTILLKKAINILIESNVGQILIGVRVNNYEAQKLYERVGFTDREIIYAYRKKLR